MQESVVLFHVHKSNKIDRLSICSSVCTLPQSLAHDLKQLKDNGHFSPRCEKTTSSIANAYHHLQQVYLGVVEVRTLTLPFWGSYFLLCPSIAF
jgi:hypothetical protein